MERPASERRGQQANGATGERAARPASKWRDRRASGAASEQKQATAVE